MATMRTSASSTLAAFATQSSAPQSSVMMKKSSSFSFSALAAAASHNKGGTTPLTSTAAPAGPCKLDLARLSMLAKGGGAKKAPADDSFKRWEEMRAKKLEALNLRTKRKGGTTIIETVTSASTSSSTTTTNSNPAVTTTTSSIPKSSSTAKIVIEKRIKPQPEVPTIKYNHQESIRPPPLRPRNPPHKSSSSSSHRHRERERSLHRTSSQAAATSSIRRPKISLHPSWYTENITNQSMDDSDGDSVVVKRPPLTTSASFSHYNARNNNDRFNSQYRNSFHHFDLNGNNRANNININISNTANTRVQGLHHLHSSFEDDSYDFDFPPPPPAHPQTSQQHQKQQQQHFERHRNYPKSHSCSFAERRSREYAMVTDARSRSVPKSHSFTG